MGTAGRAGRTALVRTVVAPPLSDTVPHAWHCGHRPAHFTPCQPHSVQRYAVLFALATPPA
ncbi:hypothetical protein GCM10025788_15960 [Serinicoccus chungangensis]